VACVGGGLVSSVVWVVVCNKLSGGLSLFGGLSEERIVQ